ELYPAGSEQADMRPRWRKPRVSWPNFFLVCDRILKRLRPFRLEGLRRRAVRKCEEWLVEHMGEGSDGLGAIFPAMLNSILALKALGYSND
ncbi:squalene--hopene cyclase, partial [Streptococcus pneumoniae]